MPASPEKQTLTEKGASPQIRIPTYNETATDALGRTLVTYKEAGFPKKDKYVGLFYLIWTDGSEGFTSNIDVTKAYASDPENPYLGIPRSLLGLTEDVFTLNFHWMDNVTDVYDRHSWFTTGDSARLYLDGRLAAEIMHSPADEAHKLVNGGRGLRLAEGYHALRLEYAEIGGGCPSLTLAGEWSFYRLP